MLIERICARICTRTITTAEHHAAARRAFEDTLAVALAGWCEPVSQAARRYARGNEHSLIVDGGACSAEHAAFVHAVAGHALDYDDVHLVSVTHPSVVIVPTLLALSPLRARGRSLLDAYAVGVSVNIALGHALGAAHYARGWHATSTIGPLAAAAAGCHLLELDERQTRSALALAAAQSAGLQRNFGSMAKPIQAGNAASAGVRAVRLAADDVSGDADIFGAKGFADLYAEGLHSAPPLLVEDVHSISLKLYPCCYATHRMIAAAQSARTALALPEQLASVEKIELYAPIETLRPLRVVDPRSGSEAKFCAAYVLAVALLRGLVGLRDFTDEAVRRPEVRTLMERVRCIESDEASAEAVVGLAKGQVRVRLHGRSGLLGEASCAVFPGSPESPASADQLSAKVEECAAAYAANTGRAFTGSDLRRLVAGLID